MTFLQIVNAVLADAFAEGKRADAKNWVNHRYTWLCDLEEWPFMRATTVVTVTAGSATVTNVPTDFAIAQALLDQYGTPLEPVRDPQDFYDRYYGQTVANGKPEAFTIDGGVLLVGPTSNETSALYKLVYQRAAAALSADGDVPIIPTGYHMGLVHGGKAEGFRLTNVPLADQFDADFRGTVDAMRAKYLSPMRDKRRQSPAYRAC